MFFSLATWLQLNISKFVLVKKKLKSLILLCSSKVLIENKILKIMIITKVISYVWPSWYTYPICVLAFRRQKYFQTVVYGGTFVVTGISIWIQCYGYKFYLIHRPYYPLERAIYAVLVRCTWFIVSAWIVLCHFTIRGGELNSFQ